MCTLHSSQLIFQTTHHKLAPVDNSIVSNSAFQQLERLPNHKRFHIYV